MGISAIGARGGVCLPSVEGVCDGGWGRGDSLQPHLKSGHTSDSWLMNHSSIEGITSLRSSAAVYGIPPERDTLIGACYCPRLLIF